MPACRSRPRALRTASSQASVPVLCAAMRMRSAAIALDAASVAVATIVMPTHKSTPERHTPFIGTLWFTLRQMSASWAGAQPNTSILPLRLACDTMVRHGDTVQHAGKAGERIATAATHLERATKLPIMPRSAHSQNKINREETNDAHNAFVCIADDGPHRGSDSSTRPNRGRSEERRENAGQRAGLRHGLF